jgi:type I restriction enzyme, R subunit
LLREILADLKALRIDYETFLKRIADLAKQVQAGKAADTPENSILQVSAPSTTI